MEVILLTDVEKLGLRGDVVNVSRGFMRNYLGPRRLAEPATPGRVAELAKREAQRARHEARSVEQAEEIAETLRKTVLRFEVNAGPRGRLFGSVTPTNIVDELWRTRKIRVDRRKIELGDPIRRVGRYEVPIQLFEDVRTEVKTLVVPEGGELPSDDELEAWEAQERAEAAAAARETPEEAAEPEDDVPSADEAGEPASVREPAPEDVPAPGEPAGDDAADGAGDGYVEQATAAGAWDAADVGGETGAEDEPAPG